MGDFGLATSSLAAVDPSDVAPRAVAPQADMTLGLSHYYRVSTRHSHIPVEVGTRLYIAPEVQSRRRGPTNHSKADMYSLGARTFWLIRFISLIVSVDCVFRDELRVFHWLRTHICPRKTSEIGRSVPSNLGSFASASA